MQAASSTSALSQCFKGRREMKAADRRRLMESEDQILLLQRGADKKKETSTSYQFTGSCPTIPCATFTWLSAFSDRLPPHTDCSS